MRIGQTLATLLTGFTLLVLAGPAHGQGSIESLKSKVLSFQNTHAKMEISLPGEARTLVVLPAACQRTSGLDKVYTNLNPLSLSTWADIGLNYANGAMTWNDTFESIGVDVDDLALQQNRICAVNLPLGAQITAIKAFAKVGPASHIDVFLAEQSSGISDAPYEQITDACEIQINRYNGPFPSGTVYESRCPVRIKDARAYTLLLFMNKAADDGVASTVLQSVQIQYRLPRAAGSSVIRAGDSN